MTLNDMAQTVLDAVQCGRMEDAEDGLAAFNQMAARGIRAGNLDSAGEAMETIRQAKDIARAHRAHLMQSLQDAVRESLYGPQNVVSPPAWQIDG